MYEQYPVSLTVGSTSGTTVISIPFSATYYAVQNQTNAIVTFATGELSQPPSDAVTIQPTKSMVGQMYATQNITIWWSAAAAITSGQNIVIFSVSDRQIQLQVSDNGVVQVSGDVSVTIAPGQTVEIGGNPTVDLNGPVTVSSITETVNIQGNVASALTNSFVPDNPLILFQEDYVLNISNMAANQEVSINTTGPMGLYDAIIVYFESDNGFATYYDLFGTAMYIHAEEGVPQYDCQTANFANYWFTKIGYDITNGNHAFVTNMYTFPVVAGSLIQFHIKNTSSNTIVSDTLHINVYVVKSQTLIGSISNAYYFEYAAVPFTTSAQNFTPSGVPAVGIIKKIVCTSFSFPSWTSQYASGYSGTISILNGGNQIFSLPGANIPVGGAGFPINPFLDLGDGAPINGIQIQFGGITNTNASVTVSGSYFLSGYLIVS